VINIFTPNLKDIMTMTCRSPDWPFDKPNSPFVEFVDRTAFSRFFNVPEPGEQSTSWERNIHQMRLQDACYKARTIADTVAAAAEQAGLVLVPRQPSPRMADAVRQLLQTNPGAPFEEIWATATLAAAADEEIWAAASAAADEVAKTATDTADDVLETATDTIRPDQCFTRHHEIFGDAIDQNETDSPSIHSFQAMFDVFRRSRKLKLPPTVHPLVHALAADPGGFLYRSGFCILPRAATAAMIDAARELGPHAVPETVWSSMMAAAEEEIGTAR
jgi:cell division septum initiation protein DivIVA